MAKRTDPRIELLLENLDRAYERRSWHGATLKGSLRGLTTEVALWRPAQGRNSIWQLILHAAYWKFVVWRALTGRREERFSRSPGNFPHVPDPATEKALRADRRLLGDEHARLREAIAAFPADRLRRRLGKKGPTPLALILGIAAHDLHHGGQVQVLKRLYAAR